jgi:hypothetical protein
MRGEAILCLSLEVVLKSLLVHEMPVPHHFKPCRHLPLHEIISDTMILPLPETAIDDSLHEREPHHRVVLPLMKAHIDINLFDLLTETMEHLQDPSLEFLWVSAIEFQSGPCLEEDELVSGGRQYGLDLHLLRL